MHKIKYFILFYLLFSATNAFPQPDKAEVGLFVTSLYDFDLDKQSFTADFWMWLNYENDHLLDLAIDLAKSSEVLNSKSYDANKFLEIPNAKSSDFKAFTVDKKGNINWASVKCHAVCRANWDISDFPFDKQKIVIEIEDSQRTTDQLIFTADKKNSKIDENVSLDDWKILDFKVDAQKKEYNTTFGDPALTAKAKSIYPAIHAEITMERKSTWTIFFKMFTGVYVAFMISIFVFFIKPTHVDPRFGLCVGGMFASIGNYYVVGSYISSPTANTLIDNIHNLTFISILVCIGASIMSLFFYEKNDSKSKELSIKIDQISFFSIMAVYISCNLFFVYSALS